MGGIFLSYAREDRACAERLARVLEDAGHQVWWDRHIDGGEDFAQEIEEQLDKADVVLVAWSKESIASRWVRDEAAVGGDTGRLVPVSIDGSRPPMGFRQFHTLDLTRWKNAARDSRTAELLRAVEGRLAEPGKSTSHQRQLGDRSAVNRGLPKGIPAATLILVLIAGLAYLWLSRAHSGDGGSKPTIAVLPFTTTSSDDQLKSLASQARDSTGHTLSDSGMPVRLLDSAPPGGAVPADYLLSADFSSGPEAIVATVRLEEAARRETIWSRRIEVERKDASLLPDRVGAQTAGSLSWAAVLRALGGSPAVPVELKADLLRQLGGTGDPIQYFQISQRLVRKWPEVGLTQLGLGFFTGFALAEIPRDQRPEAVTAARQAAARAQALMPDFGDAYVPQCLLQPPIHFAQCEDQFRQGIRADPDAPFVNSFLAALLNNVGRTSEAFEVTRLSHLHDPYLPSKIALMIQMLTVMGDDAGAYRLYRQAIGWWPDSGLQQGLFWGLIERGDFDAIVRLGDRIGPTDIDPGYVGMIAIARAVKARSNASLQRECGRQNGHWLEPAECMLAFATLGDLNAAYALADQLYPDRFGGTPQEAEGLWLDNPDGMPLEFLTSRAAAPLRRDPRYIALAQRTGLLAYWRSGRRPDFCNKQPEAICATLLRR